MKAKHFTTGAKQEIVLESGKTYKALPGESQSTFADRVVAKVQNEELDDLEIALINKKKIETLSNERAVEIVKGASGLEKEMLEELLETRGISFNGDSESSVTDESNTNLNKENVKKPTKGKLVIKNTDEEVKPEGTAKAAKVEKVKAEKPAPMTKEEREVAIEEFKKTPVYTVPFSHIGKDVIYSTKNTVNGKGTIKSLSINKTLSKVYYTIQNADTKKRECVVLENVQFVK